MKIAAIVVGRRGRELAEDRPELVDVRRRVDVDASVERPRERDGARTRGSSRCRSSRPRRADPRTAPAPRPRSPGRRARRPSRARRREGCRSSARSAAGAGRRRHRASNRRRPCGRRPPPGRRGRAPGPRCRAWPSSAPPAVRARRRAGSTLTSFIRPRSMTRPPSVVEWPTALWPPARTAISRSRSRPKRMAAMTSSTLDGRRMTAGPPIEHRVPDPPGIVVLGGIGRDDLARECAAQLVELGSRGRRGT